jgi:hypothetical protein
MEVILLLTALMTIATVTHTFRVMAKDTKTGLMRLTSATQICFNVQKKIMNH